MHDSNTGAFRFFKPGQGAGETVPITNPATAIDGGLAVFSAPKAGPSFVFYLEGGTSDSGAPGAGIAVNRLYAAEVDFNGETISVESPFSLVADFDLNELPNNTAGPVLSGLAAMNDGLYVSQRRFNGGPSSQGDANTAIYQLNFDRGGGGSGGPGLFNVLELPNADIHTIAGDTSRGSLFAVGLVTPENPRGGYDNLAVFEIDPRADSPYIKNTQWGAAGDFDVSAATNVGADFNSATQSQIAKIGGAAMTNAGLVISAFASTDQFNGRGQNGFFITANPNHTTPPGLRGSTATSALNALNGGGGIATAGMSGIGAQTISPPPFTLDNGPGGRDYSMGFNFARVSYSSEALASGVIQQIFRQRFIETAQDPVFCSIDPVIGQIPGALGNNANKTEGIARTTYDLRHPLSEQHPCQTPTSRAR